jgi:hypothetical protein
MANRGGRKKGCVKTGGRAPGTPNRATANAREAIAHFVDANVDRLQGWLDQIAKKDGPRAAWDCFWGSVEYHVPKLQRTELHVALPTFTGDPTVVSDPIEAAVAYERIVRGEIAPEAIRFLPSVSLEGSERGDPAGAGVGTQGPGPEALAAREGHG